MSIIYITPAYAFFYDETSKRGSSSRLLEEVMVTAQKRSENSQDVPIAINAFSGETLDARGITDPMDLPQVTPGLNIGSQAGYTVTFLRGVGSDAYLLADPSVAMYIDNVYFPFAHGAAQSFGTVERIEVLKGPQGTLFGRNAVGGAISVVSKAPSFEGVNGSLLASYGNYNDLDTKFYINIPVTDTFALDISGIYNTTDNYRDGIAAGRPLPQERTKGGRIKLLWAPSESFDISLAAFKLQQDGVSSMFATNSDPSPAFEALITPQTGIDGENDAPVYFELDNEVFYGQANFYTNSFDAKLIASDQQIQTGALYDFDGSPTPLVSFEIPKQGADVQTLELQLLSNESSWKSDDFTWIMGYYYFTSIQGMDEIRFGVANSLLGGIGDLLTPILTGLGLGPLQPGEPLIANGLMETDSNSIFTQGTYQFTDWLALTLGARLQEEKRTLISSGGAVNTPLGNTSYTSYSGQNDTTKSISPKVSFELTPWDDVLIYLSYQEAVKSSTFNVVNFLNFSEPEPVKKEELDAYELGLKTTLFDGTTTLSAAVFHYDMKNLQVQFLSLLAGGAVTFENAPAAEIDGMDFDITSQIMPDLLPGLILTAGGAFLDARFTEFPEGQGFDSSTGLYTTGNNFNGKRIPRSPEFSGNLGLSQTININMGNTLEISVDYYYNSGFFYLAENSDFSEEGKYDLLGARVSYFYEPYSLRVTLYGKNILDEQYNYSRFTSDFGSSDHVAPPAQYGVRVNLDF